MGRALLITLLGFFAFAANAQQNGCNIKVQGRIADEHEAKPLPFATILIVELQRGATSEEDGAFVLNDICPGSYTFQISHLGCETIEQQINIQKDTSLLFELEHHTELLELVQVQSTRLQPKSSAAEGSLRGAELDRLRGKTLGESLKAFTGLSTINTGANISKPVIHGLHSSRIQIMNHGVQQEGQEWGLEHAPEIDPFAANEIKVIKGVGAIAYGTGALGGVVLLDHTSLPSGQRYSGNVHLIGMSNGRQLISAVQFAERRNENFSYRIQGSYKKGGDLNAPDYQLTNTGATELNFSLGATYQQENWSSKLYLSRYDSETGILRGAHIGNLTDLEAAYAREEPFFTEDFSYEINNPRQKVSHYLARWEQELKTDHGRWVGDISYQLNQRQEFDIRRGERNDIPAVDLNLQALRNNIFWEHQPWGDWVGKIGWSGFYRQNRNDETGVRPLIPWYNNYGGSLFWTERWLREAFQLELGARYDIQHLQVKKFDQQNNLQEFNYNFTGLTLAAGLITQLNSELQFSSNLGYTFRPPNVSELFSEGLHHGSAAIEEGNIGLDTERGLKWINALIFQREGRWNIEVDAYVHLIDNYIYLRPQEENRLTIRGAFPVFAYTQTNARLYGLDVLAEFQLPGNFNLETKAAIVRARDLELDEPLFLMPADRVSAQLFYSLSGNRKMKDLRFGFGVSHIARQSRAPEGLDFVPPPAGYTLLNAEVSSNWLVGGQTLGVVLSVNNLVNVAYRDYLNRLRYFADNAGRNIELKLKYQFSK